MGQHKLTAIIYDKKGKILSIGENSYTKTHPLMHHYASLAGTPEKVYLHAEIAAIIRCPDLSKAHKIFISRVTKSGGYGFAKPCPICISAIKATNIKIIEHT